MRIAIAGIGALGALIFGVLFLMSFAAPGFVEQAGKAAIRHQVEKKVGERVDALDTAFLVRQAERLSGEYRAQVAEAEAQLRARLPQRIAEQLALMADLNCECRRKIERALLDGTHWRIGSSLQMQAQLDALIRAQYMDTAESLTREFRIFTGSNALAFGLLLLAVIIKKQARLQLLPASLVLVSAAFITAYLYLFNQNWLHTLLFNDYVGYAYVAYLGVVFAFLSDLVFNRARVTAQILSNVLEGIGSNLVVPLC